MNVENEDNRAMVVFHRDILFLELVFNNRLSIYFNTPNAALPHGELFR